MSDDATETTPRSGQLERYAIDCALYSAWRSHQLGWNLLDTEHSFVDHFEASVSNNLELLEGLEDLGEDIARRGIIAPAEGGQAALATDGGAPDGT